MLLAIVFFVLFICIPAQTAPCNLRNTTDQTSVHEATDFMVIKDKMDDAPMQSPVARGPIDLLVDGVVGMFKAVRDEFSKQSEKYNSMTTEEYVKTLLYASSRACYA
ncbi:hypothetical protein PMAYCL1PPCAC_15181 [Pristionchus mayeri]|uniref:Secreted protein n=1 Tax=Pristionchus mayeri TaxID=1317129 RepID=A0AAN5HYB4_9BILA|nr:hypothetical protein PMAYCL1PPCAC_15181 [Pristionchus mayeri]